MKILVAVAESGREPVGQEMVRVPQLADCQHRAPCVCNARWVSTLPGVGRWALARVVEPPGCFDLHPNLDTPEVRRMLRLAGGITPGGIVRLCYHPERIGDVEGSPNALERRAINALAYDVLVIGPN